MALRPALDESGSFLTRQGRVIPSALEMLMAEISLDEEETMARRKKKDAARAWRFLCSLLLHHVCSVFMPLAALRSDSLSLMGFC